jgi:signal peptidase I
MEPSLHPGQFLVLERHGTNRLMRGDVIAFRQGSEVLIKRVVGMPGDSLWLYRPRGGESTDVMLPVPRDLERFRRLVSRHPEDRLYRIQIPAGTVYAIGDNTTNSIDSRAFGPVPETRILGRAVAPGSLLGAGRSI